MTTCLGNGNNTVLGLIMAAHWGAVGWGTALQAGRSRVRFLMVSELFIDLILMAALWSTQPLKGTWCTGLTTFHLYVPVVWKSGASSSWKPQGLSRLVQELLYLCVHILWDVLNCVWVQVLWLLTHCYSDIKTLILTLLLHLNNLLRDMFRSSVFFIN